MAKLKLPEFPGWDEDLIREILINSAGSLDELDAILDSWIKKGQITEDEALALATELGSLIDPGNFFGMEPEVVDYLSSASNSRDLADRILKFGIDENLSGRIFKSFSARARTSKGALAGARGRSLAEQVEATAERERQQFQQEVAKINEQNAISQLLAKMGSRQVLTGVQPSGEGEGDNGTGDLGEAERLFDIFQNEPYQRGLGEGIAEILANVQKDRDRARAINYLSEAQRVDAQNARWNKSYTQRMQETKARAWANPPGTQALFDKMVAGTNLGAGTRLEQFIRSELAREASAPSMDLNRRRWWSGVMGTSRSPGPDAPEFRRATALAHTPTLSPEELGEGVTFPVGETVGDPLWRIFNEREFRNRYFRRPGAGLVSRLTPAVRF